MVESYLRTTAEHLLGYATITRGESRREAQLADLLAAEDVEHFAAAMEPGSTAGVLIWENLWAAPFASAARRSGGQLIATGRIPIQAIIASIEADKEPATVGD